MSSQRCGALLLALGVVYQSIFRIDTEGMRWQSWVMTVLLICGLSLCFSRTPGTEPTDEDDDSDGPAHESSPPLGG